MIRFLSAALVASTLAVPAAWAADPLQSPGMTVTTLQQAGTDNTGKPLRYPKGTPQITTMMIEIAPGASTPPHRHPQPLVSYVMQGELEIRAEGGAVNRYKAGDAFVETVGSTHAGTNIGTVPVKLLVTVVGVKGTPFTQPAEKKR